MCTFLKNSCTFVSSSNYFPRRRQDVPLNRGRFGPAVGPHPRGSYHMATLGLGSVVSCMLVDVRTHGGSLLLQAIKNRYTLVPEPQYRVNFTGLGSSLANTLRYYSCNSLMLRACPDYKVCATNTSIPCINKTENNTKLTKYTFIM